MLRFTHYNSPHCGYDGVDCLQTCDLWSDNPNCSLDTLVLGGEGNFACSTSEGGWYLGWLDVAVWLRHVELVAWIDSFDYALIDSN